MRTIFEKLKKISAEYRENVDSLAQDHDLESRHDFQLRDEIKAQRAAERNARFNGLIDRAAEEAHTAAELEINKLRAAVQTFITSSTDPSAMQTLQGLIAAGVELTDTEINAFAGTGGYGVLRLLERPSGGRIKPPKMESLEADLQALETYFKDISAFRGELSGINTARPWGQRPETGSKIQEGRIEHFPETLDAMAARWSALEK